MVRRIRNQVVLVLFLVIEKPGMEDEVEVEEENLCRTERSYGIALQRAQRVVGGQPAEATKRGACTLGSTLCFSALK
jgi:hypothetical protein